MVVEGCGCCLQAATASAELRCDPPRLASSQPLLFFFVCIVDRDTRYVLAAAVINAGPRRAAITLPLHPHNTLTSVIVRLLHLHPSTLYTVHLHPRTHSHNKHNCNTFLKHTQLNQHVRSRFVSLLPHQSSFLLTS